LDPDWQPCRVAAGVPRPCRPHTTPFDHFRLLSRMKTSVIPSERTE
jgi:hypothetical protein